MPERKSQLHHQLFFNVQHKSSVHHHVGLGVTHRQSRALLRVWTPWPLNFWAYKGHGACSWGLIVLRCERWSLQSGGIGSLGVWITCSTGLGLLTVEIVKQVQYSHLDELGGCICMWSCRMLLEGRAQTLHPQCCLYAQPGVYLAHGRCCGANVCLQCWILLLGTSFPQPNGPISLHPSCKGCLTLSAHQSLDFSSWGTQTGAAAPFITEMLPIPSHMSCGTYSSHCSWRTPNEFGGSTVPFWGALNNPTILEQAWALQSSFAQVQPPSRWEIQGLRSHWQLTNPHRANIIWSYLSNLKTFI